MFNKQSYDTPSDSVKEEDLEMMLPKWFDEELFNKGRNFFWRFCFGFSAMAASGLVSVFSVPSILDILMYTKRSATTYTAYKRYVSTFLHMRAWFKYELKPGSVSWKSLEAIRKRHLRGGRSARFNKLGTISQRDVALTQFGFIGYVILKPDMFGIKQQKEDDWESFVHFWKVVGYMLGLEDRYNLCRKNFEETRQVCQQILDRVYTPCLENVPEYFEHVCRTAMDGIWLINSSTESGSFIYFTRNLANVPGYILTESERIALQTRIKEKLNGKNEDIGVDSSCFVQKSAVEGLPERTPKLFFLKDYESVENAPEYKKLSAAAKYKLALASVMITFYTTGIGRFLFNWYYIINLKIAEYFPYVPFFLYGIKKSYINLFEETPKDDTKLKPNLYYYQLQTPEPWYKKILSFW